jgi:peptidoglycan hydrolase-like protein with peptidoglycan-binding domain
VVARVVDRAFENPAMSGGLMVMALTAAAIVSNAMLLQNSRHPEPLFSTRPLASLEAPKAPPTVPIPRSRARNGSVDAPRPSPRPPAVAPTAATPAGLPDADLVTGLQRELARLGLYTGSIDGIAGSRTKAAITAYETAAGRAATGNPTAELLEIMTNPAPVDAQPVETVAAPTPATERDDAAAEPAKVAAFQTELYRLAQAALNQIGYGPIAVDGHPGDETTNAIRRFELDNGLPITGEIGDRVIGRLVSIGAMQAL